MSNFEAVISLSFMGGISLIAILGAIRQFIVEKKLFNNGVCTECGNKLTCVDTDSQGGRYYRCSCCSNNMWISYSVDKKCYKM